MTITNSTTYFDRVGLGLDREPDDIPQETKRWVQSQVERHVPETEWREILAMLFAPIYVKQDVRAR